MNRAKTRINQFAVSCRKLQAQPPEKKRWDRADFPECCLVRIARHCPLGRLLKAERPLVFDILRLDRFVTIPKIENGGNDNSDPQAAEKKQAIGRQPDQENKHQRPRDNQPCFASQAGSGRFWLRIPFHTNDPVYILSEFPKVFSSRALPSVFARFALKTFKRKERKGIRKVRKGATKKARLRGPA
ncbi:MAG: hypothetical protein ACRD20_15775 [Terriglobales bacterium]